MSLSGQAFQLTNPISAGQVTVATPLNHFWFDKLPVATRKSPSTDPPSWSILTRLLELEKILRVMRETLFHSRLSCVMLAPLVLEAKLWAAPKRNLNRRGAEERDACYA